MSKSLDKLSASPLTTLNINTIAKMVLSIRSSCLVVWVLLALCTPFDSSASSDVLHGAAVAASDNDTAPSAVDPNAPPLLHQTDRDVQSRLAQLRTTLTALHATVDQLRQGHTNHSRTQEERMRGKLRRLAATIAKLAAANGKLAAENRTLRTAKASLATRLDGLEAKAASAAARPSGTAGLTALVAELAAEAEALLREGGLEHFSSPRFSPGVAGVVSNGVLLAPLAAAGLHVAGGKPGCGGGSGGGGSAARRALGALLAFDAAFASALVVAGLLVVGDPVAALRHISEANLALLQVVLAGVAAGVAACGAATLARGGPDRARVAAALAAKAGLAAPYAARVWAPVMDGDDVPVGMPVWWYAAAPVVGWVCVRAVRERDGGATAAAHAD